MPRTLTVPQIRTAPRMCACRCRLRLPDVRLFLLCHRHEAPQCRIAFVAWKGFDSPLRSTRALASCERGGHAVWWTVQAADDGAALAQLPPYVAARTEAVEVTELTVP